MTKSEAQTCSELIDRQLAQSGWNVKDPTQVVEKFDILTGLPPGVAESRTLYEGHQFSDYVLLGKDRKPLAAFKEHMLNEPRWPNVGEKLIAKDRRIYVATYPTMLNIIRDEAQHLVTALCAPWKAMASSSFIAVQNLVQSRPKLWQPSFWIVLD